ncbi:MAG: helix-turn-helix transcriptional regulator [Bacilli bacterium]|nr:helix-turn-helix transcriptional regulator [Bacilli bacterium]
MSQAALGERVGMKQSAVARIESKRVSPTLNTIQALLEAVGLDICICTSDEAEKKRTVRWMHD